mmetsp:Transcript_154333/g.474301  ORF Transcript_154333/g.474301 Transcript_154333/m.474301 type:complete len:306 (+) Transcript_154333:87-1004(+)
MLWRHLQSAPRGHTPLLTYCQQKLCSSWASSARHHSVSLVPATAEATPLKRAPDEPAALAVVRCSTPMMSWPRYGHKAWLSMSKTAWWPLCCSSAPAQPQSHTTKPPEALLATSTAPLPKARQAASQTMLAYAAWVAALPAQEAGAEATLPLAPAAPPVEAQPLSCICTGCAAAFNEPLGRGAPGGGEGISSAAALLGFSFSKARRIAPLRRPSSGSRSTRPSSSSSSAVADDATSDLQNSRRSELRVLLPEICAVAGSSAGDLAPGAVVADSAGDLAPLASSSSLPLLSSASGSEGGEVVSPSS